MAVWTKIDYTRLGVTPTSLAVVNDNFALYLSGTNLESTCQSAYEMDLSSESPHWRLTYDMLVKQRWFKVGVINNFIYAVGDHDGESGLHSSEVFDCRTREWSRISSMSTRRRCHGLGVLNNCLYVILQLRGRVTKYLRVQRPRGCAVRCFQDPQARGA